MKFYGFSRITVRGFPTVEEMNNPYIYKDVEVMINVSKHDYPEDIQRIIKQRNISIWHFPLVEEGPDMGIENILKAIEVLDDADKAGKHVVLHCAFGANRSRTVAEAFYFYKYGRQLEDNYHDYQNRLVYNCQMGHLPVQADMEAILLDFRSKRQSEK